MNRVRKECGIAGRRVATLARALALCAATLCVSAAYASEAGVSVLQQQLEQVQAQLRELAQENRALREEQQRMQRQLARLSEALPGAAAAPAGATASTAAASASALPALSMAPSSYSGAAGPRLWGYGEMYYADPVRAGDRARADLARAVFGLGYSFDERTEFNSEYEVEHAVASAGDVGEFEVEQFYVDRRLSNSVSARAGLFLMPFGFLNEHHEPTHFYGMQRNFIETLIIPSTWREGGFNLHGDTRAGFGWNVGLTTGADLSKWEFAPAFPQYASALELENSGAAPLQATHQELALANAQHLSQYAALELLRCAGAAARGRNQHRRIPRRG